MALNVAKEVAALERMSVNDLCERYRETFGEETNARNKRWLVKRIAWKLQANAEVSIATKTQPFSQVGWGGCDSLIATISLSD